MEEHHKLTVESELTTLIGKYGINMVHITLMSRMKNDYYYLKHIFDEKKVKHVEEEVVVEVKPIKKVTEAVVVVNEVLNEVVNDKEVRTSKENKAWQKEQEEKKDTENKAKGIKKNDLLTKENLKKWIEEDGRTFAYISREYVGCKDSEVSSAAKLFGIDTSRKNIMVKSSSKK